MKANVSDNDYTQNQDRSETVGEPAAMYHTTPSATSPVSDPDSNLSYEEMARKYNLLTVDEFFDKLDSQLREHFRNA